MRPAYSVVFLTTLIGAGQGLFLALYAAELLASTGAAGMPPKALFIAGSITILALTAAGLLASFFHLGRPERAWRSAAMWRTSWLSREVIALPLFMALAAAWGFAHYREMESTRVIGAAAAAACLVLFYCTAMIYACIKFLQEWASRFTVANFFLLGCASGLTLSAPLAAYFHPPLMAPFVIAAIAATAVAFAVRMAFLRRNARIRPKSTLQSAIGVRHPQVKQQSQGFTAHSFNTIEFFHGVSPAGLRRIVAAFVLLTFIVPVVLLVLGARAGSLALLAAAFAVQYAGLIYERWFFLAQGNHPQNLYYRQAA